MISLNENEKIISKDYSTLLDGLSQKQGKLYLTNERLIFEDKKNSSNNIYIKLEEIRSYKELRLFLKLKQGFDIKLDSGINYCFSLGWWFSKVEKYLLKLEETKGSPLEKETEIKHFWFPNIIFGLFIFWFVVIPIFTTIYSTTTDFIQNFSSVETKKSSCDLKYNINKSQYELLFDYVKKHPFCETYTIYTDYEDDYGNIVWEPFSRVTDLSKEEYDEIRKYQYYSNRIPMSGFKFTPINRK